MEKINDYIKALALKVVMFEKDDIPGMGQTLNAISSLEDHCERIDGSVFLSVTQAVKGYLGKLILGEAEDTTPLEEGITCLQSIYRSLSRDERSQQDVSFIREELDIEEILNETDESQSESRAKDEFAVGEIKKFYIL